jgi:pimeloyl-ACP methyl ester carboxylesterase
MQVIASDLMISYTRQGKGKPVVILHGWGDDSRSWQKFAAELAKHYDVVVPDLPGFGNSQAPQAPWGLDEYAKMVATFLQKLGVKPYAILGHSNGGAIAIRGLGNHMLKAEKLLLLSSAGIRGEYKGRNKALRLITKTGKLLSAPLPKATKQRLRVKVYKSVGSDMLVAEHLQETFKKVVADDVRTDAGRIKLPTLIIYGDKDTQTPLSYGRTYHELIKGSKLEVLNGIDHFVQLNAAPMILKLVKDFLK